MMFSSRRICSRTSCVRSPESSSCYGLPVCKKWIFYSWQRSSEHLPALAKSQAGAGSAAGLRPINAAWGAGVGSSTLVAASPAALAPVARSPTWPRMGPYFAHKPVRRHAFGKHRSQVVIKRQSMQDHARCGTSHPCTSDADQTPSNANSVRTDSRRIKPSASMGRSWQRHEGVHGVTLHAIPDPLQLLTAATPDAVVRCRSRANACARTSVSSRCLGRRAIHRGERLGLPRADRHASVSKQSQTAWQILLRFSRSPVAFLVFFTVATVAGVIAARFLGPAYRGLHARAQVLVELAQFVDRPDGLAEDQQAHAGLVLGGPSSRSMQISGWPVSSLSRAQMQSSASPRRGAIVSSRGADQFPGQHLTADMKPRAHTWPNAGHSRSFPSSARCSSLKLATMPRMSTAAGRKPHSAIGAVCWASSWPTT